MLPSTKSITKIMADTGMGEYQAINHLRQRALLQRRKNEEPRVPQSWLK